MGKISNANHKDMDECIRNSFSRFRIATGLISNRKIQKRTTLKKPPTGNNSSNIEEAGGSMSSLNISSPTTTFFDIGGYKPNIKRIKDGLDQIDEFTKMVKERSELEIRYSKALQMWNSRWSGYVDKEVSEGTIKKGFSAILDESKELIKVHSNIHDRINGEVVNTVALYRKDNHTTKAFGGIKEVSEIDKSFKKAEVDWKKMYEKEESAKKTYHNACKAERSASQALQTNLADTSLSQDTNDKARERLVKCQDDVKKYEVLYKKALKVTSDYRKIYFDTKAFVFEKCQSEELKRMRFLNEMFSCLSNIYIDLSSPSRLNQLHRKLESDFNSNTDDIFNVDLSSWSKLYGPECPHTWPTFEHYSPEIRQISTRKDNQNENAGVVLIKQSLKEDVEVKGRNISGLNNPKLFEKRHSSNNVSATHNNEGVSLRSMENNLSTEQRSRMCISEFPLNGNIQNKVDSKSKKINSTLSSAQSTLQTTSQHVLSSPFKDPFPMITPNRGDQIKKEKQNEANDPDRESNLESVSMQDIHFNYEARALYDYQPLEDDELMLKKGEVLTVMSEPDQLGWCYGEKNGQQGLFPATYISKMI
uniref:F-BAR domain-containing protein n=1 Tax=Rhabditophanes sp. KR3021 TaxID=114890 RepID=A0AC35UI38_9BILA